MSFSTKNSWQMRAIPTHKLVKRLVLVALCCVCVVGECHDSFAELPAAGAVQQVSGGDLQEGYENSLRESVRRDQGTNRHFFDDDDATVSLHKNGNGKLTWGDGSGNSSGQGSAGQSPARKKSAFAPYTPPSASVAGARELRLKIRELVAQLFEAHKKLMGGGVALPTSFVDQDDFNSSSSFGRYIAEQLFYELNQLGVPVREYRAMTHVVPRPESGEFALSRNVGDLHKIPSPSLILTGTYYYDRDNVFLNARLFRFSDGMVLRTANLVFRQTPVTVSMLKHKLRFKLNPTAIEVKSFKTLKREQDLQSILDEDALH